MAQVGSPEPGDRTARIGSAAPRHARKVFPRRLALTGAGAAVIVTGLIVHFAAHSLASNLIADALYAALVWIIVSIIAGTRHRLIAALLAYGLCLLIEAFQLTGIPSSLARAIPAVGLVLGTSFAAVDFIAYAVGVALAAGIDAALTRNRPK